MGKGSRQRPAAITTEELDARWEATFGVKDEEPAGKIIDLMAELKKALAKKEP